MQSVVVVDYGFANLRSVLNALECFEISVSVAEAGSELKGADKIVLPGVGSFDAGIRELRRRGHEEALAETVLDKKTPYLGICVGMQFLYEGSEEGVEPGLGWIKGTVTKFPEGPGKPKVPHIGWNAVRKSKESRLFNDLAEESDFYFVHSYSAPVGGTDDSWVAGICDYGYPFAAAVEKDHISATQFHPEKSQLAGMKLIQNFLEI
ncbi:imidazole glycerol phosphate synthase subunit HisH [Hwanghaeella grinnelliae]|uniref:Imidazole glycerol phosphate synthase subunit HisH n=1 Tax=Hwanghaeella grinnelliae TaxID=2500179 RepID=A0A3S2Z9J1_9PROT|nr:imidazole glycerol phosphate synthase subunit HisH [Hwanghaeella grinnelliae]RVU36760.1 imidazole glycerol phosphate synthase subunit HisH [Hwanghaeella grinnelliae]